MKSPASNTAVIDLPPLSLRADVTSVNPETRTFEVIFSTGAAVDRFDFFTGTRYVETLSLDPKHIRIKRLNRGGVPFLDSHKTDGLSNRLGVVEPNSVTLEEKQATARIRLSKRAAVEDVWQDIQDGIIRNVSVGYRVHKYEETAATGAQPMKRRAVDWEPFEISAVLMGADDGAKVRADQQTPTNPCVITRAVQETNMADETREQPPKPQPDPEPVPQEEPRNPVSNPADPGAPIPGAISQSERQVAQTDQQRGALAERARVDGIMRSTLSLGLPIQLATKLINEGTPQLEATNILIAEKERVTLANRGNAEGPVRIEFAGVDHMTHTRRGIENALLHRIRPDWFKLDDLGRLYANRQFIGLAECWLQSCGQRTTMMNNLDIAGAALGLTLRAGLHTTSDFVLILADALGKTLRRAYLEAPQTFEPITSRKDVSDFKLVKRTQLSEAPALELVGEAGEFTSGTMAEAREQYKLETYGRIFGITRQAMINDDLDAFTNLAVSFGRSARQKESDLVWLQITSNPVMGDGVTLFHTATHGNLAGAGAAIDITTVGAGWTAMGLQKGLTANELLNITPSYLIVPKAKEVLARQFVSTQLTPAVASNVNPFAGQLTVISDPRLDAASGISWYLAADKNVVDIIELGNLAGQAGPVVESQIGFRVDGIEIKCRHDVGAKAIDWRGLYKNPGA